MKKLSKLLFSLLLFLCVPLLFTACESGKIKRYSVTFVGESCTFDAYSSTLLVEYGTIINLTEEDFVVYRVNDKGKSQPTTNFKVDASSVNNKKLLVGNYTIYIESKKEDYKEPLTVTVYEREVSKPTFSYYSVEFDQNEVDIEEYLKTLPNFNSTALTIEMSEDSVAYATAVGKYKTIIKLKYGYVWNTLSGKTQTIDFYWEITPKEIPVPTISGSSVLELDYDENYNFKDSVLKFNQNLQYSGFYKITGNTANAVGEYEATVEISNKNFVFADGSTKQTYPYSVVAKQMPTVEILGEDEFTYSGEIYAPKLDKFISKFMTASSLEHASAGIHRVAIGFKPEYAKCFKWIGTDENVIYVTYTINRKKIEKPILKNNTFTYSKQSPILEFENLNDELMKVSDTSSNISVGVYTVIVSPINSEVANNYTYDTGVLATLKFSYIIQQAKIECKIIWNVPDGQTFVDGLQAGVYIECEDVDITVSQLLYVNNGKDFQVTDSISGAGQYMLVAQIEFDRSNYMLVLQGTENEISDAHLSRIFYIES